MSVTTAQGAVLEEGAGIGFDERWVVAFAIAVVIFSAVFWASHSRPEQTDFSVTYIGAKIVHEGYASRLYDLTEQKQIRTAVFHDQSPLIFEHPPFEALLMAPLAALPYRSAYLVWGVINGCIWLGIHFFARHYAPRPRDAVGYAMLWLIFAPLGIALYQGQSSLVVLFLYALTFMHLKKNQDWKAGTYLGLGLLKFQFVIPFAAILMLQRRWKFVAGFLSASALLGLLSLIAVGWQGLKSYVSLLISIAGNPDQVSYGAAIDMATVQGFVHALLRNTVRVEVSQALVVITSAVLILGSAWYWQKQGFNRQKASFDLMFALAVVVSLVTGVHMFTHDLSPLILSLLLAIAHFPEKARVVMRWGLGSTLTLLWIPVIYFLLIKWHCMYLLFPLLMLFAITLLLMTVDSTSHRMPARRRTAV